MGALEHTEQTRARLIEAFAECGRIDMACKAVGVNRGCHYAWLKEYPAYKEAFEAARKPVADMLEDAAIKRAVDGSDDLLKFILRYRNPEVFGEKSQIAHTGANGSSLVVRFVSPEDKRDE